jgi:hypothetical protein
LPRQHGLSSASVRCRGHAAGRDPQATQPETASRRCGRHDPASRAPGASGQGRSAAGCSTLIARTWPTPLTDGSAADGMINLLGCRRTAPKQAARAARRARSPCWYTFQAGHAVPITSPAPIYTGQRRFLSFLSLWQTRVAHVCRTLVHHACVGRPQARRGASAGQVRGNGRSSETGETGTCSAAACRRPCRATMDPLRSMDSISSVASTSGARPRSRAASMSQVRSCR